MRSEAHVLLELVELVGEEREVAVDVLGVGDDGVDLVGEAHVLRLLRHQVVLAASANTYIFSSNIFTSIISLVFDSSVVCFPSFSTPWNSPVSVFKVAISVVSVFVSFLVCTCVGPHLPPPSPALRRRSTPSPGPAISWATSFVTYYIINSPRPHLSARHASSKQSLTRALSSSQDNNNRIIMEVSFYCPCGVVAAGGGWEACGREGGGRGGKALR